MSKDKKSLRIYRCPLCMNLGNDVPLKAEENRYRCLRCSFSGTRTEIEEMYKQYKKRYRHMNKRFALEDLRKM